MSKLYELLKAGVITTRAVTFVIVVAAVYMWVSGHAMTEAQQTATMLVLGLYFGGESFAKFAHKLLDKYTEEVQRK